MQNVKEMYKVQEIAFERMAWSLGFVKTMLGGIADDQLIARAGGTGNHALWIMGHYATLDDDILAMVTGSSTELSEKYGKLFSNGSEPIDDASVYPSRNELAEAMRLARERITSWVRSLNESDLYTPVPEPLLPFAPNAISIPFGIAAHDMLHAGQLASVRASLGLPRVHA